MITNGRLLRPCGGAGSGREELAGAGEKTVRDLIPVSDF